MFLTADDKWAQLVQRDRHTNGTFFYGVVTTGVYCRPTCSSRLPNRKNVRFFETWEEAEKAGYRPCKKCHPNEQDWQDSQTLAVLKACKMIKESDGPMNLGEMANRVGLSPFHFHRMFKRILGVTPKQYAVQNRLKRTRANLQKGQTVTEAIYNAGFSSSSRFYEKSSVNLGMRPSDYKNGAHDIPIRYTVVQSWLGWVLVAATGKGVCSIDLGDRPEKLKKDLFARFPKARFKKPDPNFAHMVAKVLAFLEAPHDNSLELPLDIQGTAFQHRVWEALKEIVPGSTASYAEIARRIGSPSAARAVARACAANPVAVAVPCHRVVRSNGRPGGYRWGTDRKRRLLEHEKELDAPSGSGEVGIQGLDIGNQVGAKRTGRLNVAIGDAIGIEILKNKGIT